MNTPRLLFMFGLFLPLTLICPPGNRMFTRKYSLLSVGLHLAIMATFLSRSRDLFSLLLTDVVIGLLLINVTYYMPFILPDLPHRTDYSLSEGDQKNYTLLLKIYLPKGYQGINKQLEINQPIYLSIRGMGLRRSSEPKAHV